MPSLPARAPLAGCDPVTDADPAHEYDANGHYWAGPKLKQSALRSYLGTVRVRLPDAQLDAARASAEASRALRQALPAPAPVHPPRLLRALAGAFTRAPRTRRSA